MADIRRVWPQGEPGLRLAESAAVLTLASVACYSQRIAIYHALAGHRHLVTFTPNEAFRNGLTIAFLGAGLVVGWRVAVPWGLRYLTGFDSPSIRYLPRASDHIQFTMLTLLAAGVAFQLPAMWMLRRSG